MLTNIFDTLKKIIQEVNDAAGLKQALTIVVQRTRKVMHVDASSVYFRDKKTNQWVLMATDGLNQSAIGKIRFELDEGLIGYVSSQAEPVNLEDAHTHPYYRFVLETGEDSFHGFLGVPIVQHRNVLGVLVVRQKLQRRFSADDETFLVTLAAQLSGAISLAENTGSLIQSLEKDDGKTFYLKGLSGSPGIAIGKAFVVYLPANLDAVPDNAITADEVESHINMFTQAVTRVEGEYKILSQRMKGIISKEELALFDVFGLMLKSHRLIAAVIERIKAGQWAQGALRETIAEQVKQFNAMEDAYLRERAVDVKDLGRRLLMHLQEQETVSLEITEPVVLVGEEISVAQFSEVPLKHLVAIISIKGSASSHVAILAHALGIPAVMGVDQFPVNQIKAQEVIVDGYRGQVYIKPSQVILSEFRRLIREQAALDNELKTLIDKPAVTLDGINIPLHVNTGLLEDITPSLKSGAEGVGLYRTEIPFLMRDGFPGEDEQAQVYQQVLQGFSPRPVTFRTLDIGGDKALPYFPVVEDNPFLGWRGIRIMLDHPEIFSTQIRAILKVNSYGNNLRLMLPMISDVSEVDEALKLIKKSHKELSEEGFDIPYPQIGLMIEVPSAVYQMRALAKRVDFFSVGSNDLTQYLLAVDRNNKRVAELYNCLHPAVFQAIRHIISTAHKYNKPVSVCGEMAGDPASALMLVGMGVDTLSMSVGSLLKVKYAIRSFTYKQLTHLVRQASEMEAADEIRLLFHDSIDQAGLHLYKK